MSVDHAGNDPTTADSADGTELQMPETPHWESADSRRARWHGPGEGPVQYLADTPDGAWAEFLRHEGIREEAELAKVHRALWAVELPNGLAAATPHLPAHLLRGVLAAYPACRKEARRLRHQGAAALEAPSAALVAGGARGWRVEGGLRPAADRDGRIFAVFGPRPDFVGWVAAFATRPGQELLARVHHL